MLQNRPRSSKDNGEPYVFKTVISAAAVFVLSVVIIGAVIANADIPDNLVSVMSCLILAACAYSAGYTCARLRRHKGLLCGAICGLVIFIIMLSVGVLILNAEITPPLAVKLVILVTSGAIGGVRGVNMPIKI